MNHLLSLLIALPVLGALAIALTPRRSETLQKTLGLAVSGLAFALSLALLPAFREVPGYQFVESGWWVQQWGIRYAVGVDGLSLWLVILATFLTPLALLGSWSSIHGRVREFVIFMLLLEAGMVGVFVALDLFLFYVFWEAMLIPMYFLIGIWGHDRRIYAAVKFFLYTFAGSVLMLVAFLVLYKASGLRTFSIQALAGQPVDPALQVPLFLACALAFAIKVPMWPFHTWLPDAHVEAPTAGSVILAGVLLKMGGYGFLRIAIPLFPNAAVQFAPWIGVLAVIGIVYGALVSLVQPDLKKLVAYSSVSHLGFVMLGIAALTPMGIVGSVYQMLNHGISTGALFFLVGMLYDRRHTRLISEFGGLRAIVPWYFAAFLLISLSSIAVPGFNGFVGEFLILMGSWSFRPALVAVASLGVILAAGYILWMVKRVFYGEAKNPKNEGMADLSLREAVVLVPLLLLAVLMGVASPLFTRRIEPAAFALVQHVQEHVQPARAAAAPAVQAKPADCVVPLAGPAQPGGSPAGAATEVRQ